MCQGNLDKYILYIFLFFLTEAELDFPNFSWNKVFVAISTSIKPTKLKENFFRKKNLPPRVKSPPKILARNLQEILLRTLNKHLTQRKTCYPPQDKKIQTTEIKIQISVCRESNRSKNLHWF